MDSNTLMLPVTFLPALLASEGEGRAALNQFGWDVDPAEDRTAALASQPDADGENPAQTLLTRLADTVLAADSRVVFTASGERSSTLLGFLREGDVASLLIAADGLWATHTTADRLVQVLADSITETRQKDQDWQLAQWQGDVLVACVRSRQGQYEWSAADEPHRSLLAQAETTTDLVTSVIAKTNRNNHPKE